MTSFWCFCIKALGAWFVGAEVFFCMKPFDSTDRVLSVRRSRFKVQGSKFEVHPSTHSRARQVRLRLCRAVYDANSRKTPPPHFYAFIDLRLGARRSVGSDRR